LFPMLILLKIIHSWNKWNSNLALAQLSIYNLGTLDLEDQP
jgi:hypothetical protein